jgi:hypothetical protein
MKFVYTWPVIYILLFLLPSQLTASPPKNSCADLNAIINTIVSLETQTCRAEAFFVGEAVAYSPVLGCPKKVAIVVGQSQKSPAYYYVVSSLTPYKKEFIYVEDALAFHPRKVLKDQTLVEKLSNN